MKTSVTNSSVNCNNLYNFHINQFINFSIRSLIDKYLKDKKYLVGYITFLDIFLYVNLSTYVALSVKLFGTSFLEKLPNLKNLFFNIKEFPEIKAYEADPNFNQLPYIPATFKFQF